MAERPRKMLLDIYRVSHHIIRQDLWEEITGFGQHYQLGEVHRLIVVANGDRLYTLGQVVLPIYIGGYFLYWWLTNLHRNIKLGQIFSHILGATFIWG